MHPLVERKHVDLKPANHLATVGTIFATFGKNSQDSGNISYGVEIGSERFFVKTPGCPDDPEPYLSHAQRTSFLRNAVELRASCEHEALPTLHNVIETPEGPMLVYSWGDGELLGATKAKRSDPRSPYQRFRRLPVAEICSVLDQLYGLHQDLAAAGWVAVDFYDGCLIFDFPNATLHVVDLDMYRKGPSVNDMGRMFGSTRFMAPEEFEKGSRIDQRTNVFTMGRTAFIFLSDGSTDSEPFRGSPALFEVVSKACNTDPADRFDSMQTFCQEWTRARGE